MSNETGPDRPSMSSAPFVSYAQNFEDVMLWRALKHVRHGFYIDVGANDPDHDSVTKAFYERGWRGINIEPVTQWFEKLVQARSRDVNLQVAAAAVNGEAIFYEIPDTGLSTLVRETAERHQRERGDSVLERRVAAICLTDICRRHCSSDVHFLKIDAEGAEKEVLAGLDLANVRPWIVLVESTLPMLQIQDHERWEPLLLKSGYKFVYFDGLNRFYIADEHSELRGAFSVPPNVFDGFVLASHRDAKQVQELSIQYLAMERKAEALLQHCLHMQRELAEAHKAKEEAHKAKEEAHKAMARSQVLKTRIADLEAQLKAVFASTSWRVTRPLRLLARMIRRDPALTQWLVWRVKNGARILALRVVLNPVASDLSRRVLARFPTVKARLKLFVLGHSAHPPTMPSRVTAVLHSGQFVGLSPRGRRVLLDLNRARSAGDASKQRTA